MSSASTAKPYECLLCAAPIYNSNLGIDACRAFTVFYRRHLNNPKALLCRKGTNDCYEKMGSSARPLCRKCRYTRFCLLLSQTSKGEHTKSKRKLTECSDLGSSECSSNSGPESIEMPEEGDNSFIDHGSFTLFSAHSRHSHFFDRMRKAYSMLCMIRHCGEMGTVVFAPETGEIIEGHNVEFRAFSSTSKHANSRVLHGALIQFFDACFEDFAAVPEETKDYLLNVSLKLVDALDACYRSVHHFPNEDVFLPSYSTYLNEESIERYVNGMLMNVDKEYLKTAMRNNFIRSVQVNRSNYKRVMPTNEEFLAMLGLSLWNNENSRINDEYLELVSQNRAEIMSELHKMYTRQGRADYSARLGELLLLLTSIEQTAEQTAQDCQVIKLEMQKVCGDMKRMKC